MKREILKIDHVSVIQDGEILLDNLYFSMYTGQITGLVMTDAKGYEMLTDLILHNHKIDAGTVWFDKKIVNNYAAASDRSNKAAIIEQASHLAKSLSIADNIFVMREGFKKYIIDENVLKRQVGRLISELGMGPDIEKRVNELTALERCEVELLKALTGGCRIIIIDNPSNYLSQHELPVFQNILRKICNEDIAILYIANHHEEVFSIADRTALYADSHIIKVFEKDEMTGENILPYVTEFPSARNFQPVSAEIGDEGVLHFHKVFYEHLHGLEFVLHRGECLTLLDMDNRIFNDISELLTGRTKCDRGRITLNHEDIANFAENTYLKHGLAIIPHDAATEMVYDGMSYYDNLTFLLDIKLKKSIAKRNIRRSIFKEYEPIVGKAIFDKDISGLDMKERLRLVYNRYRLFNPGVLVCIRPLARGDMYTRIEIIELIKTIRQAGTAILILTANISDTLILSDRLITVEDGKEISEYKKEEFPKIIKQTP